MARMTLEVLSAELDFPQPAVGPRAHCRACIRQAREHDLLTVRLTVVPFSRIAVDLWWNRVGGPADVQAQFGLYETSIELGSLRGNGFDAPEFHRRGFGTFAINTAVQALKASVPPALSIGCFPTPASTRWHPPSASSSITTGANSGAVSASMSCAAVLRRSITFAARWGPCNSCTRACWRASSRGALVCKSSAATCRRASNKHRPLAVRQGACWSARLWRHAGKYARSGAGR